MTNNRSVEETLKYVEDRAAMLRFLGNAAAATTDSVPEPEVFSGLADACAEIEDLVRSTRRSLDVDALGVVVKRRP